MGAGYEFERNIKAAKAARDEQALKVWEAQLTLFNSLKEAGVIQELPLEARPVQVHQFQEGEVTPEQLVIRERFTDDEKEALKSDGAVIYELQGETILSEKESQKAKGKPSFYFLVEAGERLLARPSRQIEVAIYPDPERFFVPNSFYKSVNKQEERVMQDAEELRLRLNLSAVTEIISDEAATLTEVVFQHLDATGVWLFSKEYAAAQGLAWVHGRTKNPTNVSGSVVASVGDAGPGRGLRVGDWGRDNGRHDVGAVRLVVPIENR